MLQVVKLTTKLSGDEEEPQFVIDMPRMGKVRGWFPGLPARLRQPACCTLLPWAGGRRGHAVVLPHDGASHASHTWKRWTISFPSTPSPAAPSAPCAQFVVGLGERLAPTDVDEGMRVGVDHQRLRIQLPLPTKLDSAVSMMQVEERPDVTYRCTRCGHAGGQQRCGG